MPFRLTIEPPGIQGVATGDRTLLDTARQLGVDFGSVCNGKGRCGRCKVQVLSGTTSDLTDLERQKLTEAEVAQGWRLACQVYPRSDLKIRAPGGSGREPRQPPSTRRDGTGEQAMPAIAGPPARPFGDEVIIQRHRHHERPHRREHYGQRPHRGHGGHHH